MYRSRRTTGSNWNFLGLAMIPFNSIMKFLSRTKLSPLKSHRRTGPTILKQVRGLAFTILPAQTNWPAATGVGDDQTVTHWGIVSSASGAGTLLCSGALGTSLRVTNLVQPYMAAGAMTYTKD